MFARARAFSTISNVVRSPAATPKVASVNAAVQQITTPNPKEKNQTIEKATLDLLTATAFSDKTRSGSEAVQRYQKIHREGDIYHPMDLNDARYQEQLRQRRGKPTPTEDPFDALGLDPLHEYKNFRLLTSFVSDMGKILPRSQTGVSAKNQRKLAKAIKRARAMGFMSSTNNQYDFRI